MRFIIITCSFLLIYNTLCAQITEKSISDSLNSHIKKTERRQLTILGNETRSIKGRIVDVQNLPIPYSTVALKGSSYGGVANLNGDFSINIPITESDTLVFSHIAFQKQEIPIKLIEGFIVVQLEEAHIELPEIIVSKKRIGVVEILNEAIDRMDENYYQGPYSMTIVQRSMQLDSINSSIESMDWVGEGFFPFGYDKTNNNRFRILNARTGNYDYNNQAFNYDSYKTSWKDFIGLFVLDQVLFRKNSLLNKRNLKHFTFELEDVMIDVNNTLFKIDFVCNKISPSTATYDVHQAEYYKGSIYINAEDYAIVQIESEIVWVVDELNKKRLREVDQDLTTLVLRTRADYSKIDGYYFLVKSSKFENYNTYGFRNFYYFDHKVRSDETFENLYEAKRVDYDEQYWDTIIPRYD